MYIVFLNGKRQTISEVNLINPNVLEVIGASLNLGGFNLYFDNGVKFGNYETFKYLYENISPRRYRYTNIAP